jgi:ketosteroid isomerase-like protein
MSEMLQILDRGYTLIWREDRLEEGLAGLDDDFAWVVPDHPEGAVRHGSASVIEFFREWAEPWDDLEVDWELEEVAADRGLATIDMRARGHGSGVPTEMRFFQLWTFRDGRAIRMELYSNEAEARRAAGLSGP